MVEEAAAYNLHNVFCCLMWKVGNIEPIQETWYAVELGCTSHQVKIT